MDTMLLRIFQGQVRDQCLFTITSFNGAMIALREMKEADEEFQRRDDEEAVRSGDFDAIQARWDALKAQTDADRERMDRLWYFLQNLVVAAANISKALWGKNESVAAGRAELRGSLGVDDSSPLRLRKIRNHFEHFDHRLEEWFRKSEKHWYLDRNVGSLAQWMDPPPASRDQFRTFDPTTGILTFWGDELDIRVIAEEANRILATADQEVRRPPWDERTG